MAPDVQHYAFQNHEPHSSQLHGSISSVDSDDEAEWLHRNDAYKMQAKPGGYGPIIIAHYNFVGAGSITQILGNIISSPSCFIYSNKYICSTISSTNVVMVFGC
jgi:hypothetical protein